MEGTKIFQEKDVLETRGVLVSKVMLLLMAVFYFFPLATIGYANINIYTFTGIQATFGLEHIYPGAILTGGLLLIPVVVLAINLVCRQLYNIVKCNLIGGLAQLLILMVYLIGLPIICSFENVEVVKFSVVFYMEVLLAVALIVLSVYLLSNIHIEKKVDTVEDMEKKGGRFIVLYCLSVVAILWILVNLELVGSLLFRLAFYSSFIDLW